MKSITVTELFQLLQTNANIQLIDVRDPREHAEFNIGGNLIPLSAISKHIGEIEKEIPVIVYCRKGIRSLIAIQRLQNKLPFENLVNLSGGIEDWKKQLIG